ncbi:MAG: NAD(+) synthase [Candidatus Adiutrix sp.]|jgi:NAD+ synthetase|nr:NAD(+) synthase [Candidatus Adiutrix sp.]
MKIALIQGRIGADRPADNLEHIKSSLKRPETAAASLVALPPLALSGPLGPVALTRPGLDIQLAKVFSDFLELSAQHPDTALVSTKISFNPNGRPLEEPFMVKAGRGLSPEYLGRGLGIPLFEVDGQKVAVTAAEPPAEAAEQVDVLITLRNHIFRGEPFQPPAAAPARAWRVNVGAIGGCGPYILEGSTSVHDPAGRLVGWAQGFEAATVLLDTASAALPEASPEPQEALAVLRRALVVGLRDFVRSAGDGKVLLGLSGGLDSALVAALAVEALGPERVLAVAMPSEYNAPESLSLARDLSANLGVSFLTIPIDGVREAFTRSFPPVPVAEEKAGNLADENIQARIRGVLLMYLANREDRLALTCGNKSEAAMGYSTLYGDTCGAIAPIGDIYKTKVVELARFINRDKEIIPERIITRPPSAELRAGQKDEDSLPPYEVLDSILALHLEGGLSGSKVAAQGGHSAMTVAWVLSSLKKAGFKRSQAPFCLVASPRPLSGSDWPGFDWPCI